MSVNHSQVQRGKVSQRRALPAGTAEVMRTFILYLRVWNWPGFALRL